MKRLALGLAVVLAVTIPALAANELLVAHALELKASELVEAGDYVAGEVLIRYKEPTGAFGDTEVPSGIKVPFSTVKFETGDMQEKLVELMKDPNIDSVQPNYIYTTDTWTETDDSATPDDYNLSNHWYYTLENLPEAWKMMGCPDGLNCGGDQTVVVGVVDTGLSAFDFDDTAGQTGATFVANTENQNISLYTNVAETPGNNLDDDCNGVVDDYNGIDAYGYLLTGTDTCIGEVPQVVDASYYKAGIPADTYGHGTYVTGLIASSVDNAASSVSPAFNVTIMPLAANFHFQNSFASSAIITALSYAEYYGVDVVNMSLGGPSYDPFMEAAIQDLVDAGVVVIASTGNTGLNEVMYPAGLDNVVAVGAVNSDDSRSNYSTYGSQVDLTAYVGQGASPGNATWQSSLTCFGSCDADSVDDGYINRYGIGTSYAAPQVSALAAILFSYDNTLTRDDVITLMIESAVDIGSVGKDSQTGYGVINYQRALELVDFYGSEQPQTDSVYRFYNIDTGAHFYTNSERNRDKILNDYPQYQYEGIAYQVFDSDIDGIDLSPVYQFYNVKTMAHFYTASIKQRNKVINNYPDFVYEGRKFFVYTENKVKSKPIFRFYNTETGAHFYTANAAQRKRVINNYPQFEDEGIAYYVPDYENLSTTD